MLNIPPDGSSGSSLASAYANVPYIEADDQQFVINITLQTNQSGLVAAISNIQLLPYNCYGIGEIREFEFAA